MLAPSPDANGQLPGVALPGGESLATAAVDPSPGLDTPASPQPEVYPPQSPALWQGLFNWITLSLAATCASSTTAVVAYHDLIAIEPELPCDRLAAADLSDRTRLSCAQQSASQGGLPNLVAALKIVADWPVSHPLFSEMEPLLDQWSATVVREAKAKAARQHLDWAMALAMEIPSTSAAYGEAQQLLHGWQQTRYQAVAAVYGQAQAALQQQQWATAHQALATMTKMEGRVWQTGLVPQLTQEIEAEQRASELWSQARQQSALEGNGFLIEAIALASAMDRNTYRWQQAQPLVEQWSQHLLDESLAAWYAGDLNRAITLAQGVLPYGERATPATHLVWLSQARQLALASLEQVNLAPAARAIGLAQALLIAQQIPPDSPVHAQAMASIPTWRAHWQQQRAAASPPMPSGPATGLNRSPTVPAAPTIAPPVSVQQPQFSPP